MEISVQQIKNEPSDEANVEEVNIGELFENDLFSSIKCIKEPLIPTKIVREDAEPDEFIKEEPRFDDEYDIQGTELASSVNYEQYSEQMTCLTNGNCQKEFIDANDGIQAKKRHNSTVPKRPSTKSKRQAKNTKKSKKSIQNRSIKSSKKTKLHKNHHQNKAASSTNIKSRRQPASIEHPKNPPAAKSSTKVNVLENSAFECFLCKGTVSSASNLKRHYDRFHGEKLFYCNLCPKRFSVKYSLDVHKRSHNGEKPFECGICQRKFATKINLRRHNKSCWPMNVTAQAAVKGVSNVNGREFQCYLCKLDDDVLKTIQDLQVHMITKHTGANVLPCNVCRSIFSTQSQLAQHMLCHTKYKRYECDTCKMRFTTTRNILRHKRLHTRVGLYKCDQCGKEYTTKFSRDAHQKKKHATS